MHTDGTRTGRMIPSRARLRPADRSLGLLRLVAMLLVVKHDLAVMVHDLAMVMRRCAAFHAFVGYRRRAAGDIGGLHSGRGIECGDDNQICDHGTSQKETAVQRHGDRQRSPRQDGSASVSIWNANKGLPATADAMAGSLPPTNGSVQRQPQLQLHTHRGFGRHRFTGAR